MAQSDFLDEAPTSDQITDYDERHLVTYLNLLDLDSTGTDWAEAAKLVFGLQLEDRCPQVQRMHASHLARARWMTKVGYRQLAARGHERVPTD